MGMIKYFQPFRYARRASEFYRKMSYRMGRELIVTESVGDLEIKFKTANDTEYFSRAKASYTCEKSTMHWIENIVGIDDTVYDIGANVGAYSLLIGARMKVGGGKGTVYAFEPESLNFSSLNKNIYINALQDYVLPIPLAFGEKLDLAKFFLRRFEHGAATHGLYRPESDGIQFAPAHIQGSIVMSVDEFSKLSDEVRFPNHIKIDVDGLEHTIISNMNKTLANPALKSVIVEVADNLDKGRIPAIFADQNFKLAERETWDSASGNVSNYLFVRPGTKS